MSLEFITKTKLEWEAEETRNPTTEFGKARSSVMYSCTEADSTISLEKHINPFRIAFVVPLATIKQERPPSPLFMQVSMDSQRD